ncbi:PQQ-dependent sugar dehydrogenase [Halosimplex sp. J119]
MTDDSNGTDGSTEQADETGNWLPSRRRFLEVGAATGAIAGLGNLALGRQERTYRFGGEVSAWMGQEPDAIADEENPTLELTAGTEYEVVWENLDGAPHDFTIQDDQGETITATETMSEEGATRSLTFTATEEMAQYICTVHPNTMIGDIEVTEGATATPGAETETATGTETETETETGTPGVGAGFFEAGAEVGIRQVADGPLTAPTDFADPDDGTGRFFVTDQTGELYLVRENGVRDEPLIDVSDRMVDLGTFYGLYASQTQDYDERGLLGIALHPQFEENGQLYLHYSAPPTEELRSINWDHVEVVAEFQMAEGGDSVDPDSERQLLRIPHPQYNHDAGPMAFGPDGYLYVPMGDGGGANDDMYGHADDWYETNDGGNGQDLRQNLLGDIIRIDVDEGTGGATETGTPGGTSTATPTGAEADEELPYGIPDDNPFVDEDGAMDEIYAYGFRNPFGIDFDSEGNLFVSDAGQNLWEEASVVEAGGNYGWNVKEGTHCFSTDEPSTVGAITDCPDSEPDDAPYDGSDLVDPVVEYPHVYEGQSVGITVVGGHRYENDTVSELQGAYVFGDWSADPARSEPLGRVFTAMPPDDFGGGEGAETGTETDTGTPAATATTAGAGTETAQSDETPGEEEETPAIGPDDVPRDELWEMAELQFVDGFDWFVRQFGQDQDGEIYVLANRRGVPEGETGAVLQIVPPEQGESLTATETDTGS